MTTRVLRTVVCDLAHDDGTDATSVETVTLGVDGRSVVLDLCAHHAEDFHDDVASYLDAGRPARGRRRR